MNEVMEAYLRYKEMLTKAYAEAMEEIKTLSDKQGEKIRKHVSEVMLYASNLNNRISIIDYKIEDLEEEIFKAKKA